jgi:isopenicillin-N epimerase
MTDHENQPAITTLAQLRADIAIARDYVYFQTASHGPVPDSVQQFITDMMREENRAVLAGGGPVRNVLFSQRFEAARRLVAQFLGVADDELAWTYNTTTATRLAVRSLDWKRDDRLAITDCEHASTRELRSALESIVGVRTTIISTGPDANFSPEYFLEQLNQRLTPDHRLLIMSHAANTDGRRLPIQEAVQIARARGVPTLVDGAQAIGAFPVNVGDLGADFYSGSVHKWLLGPAGVGFLVVRRDRLPHYNPHFKSRVRDESCDCETRELTAGWLSELGTPNAPLRMAGAYGVELIQRIGLDVIESHIRELAYRLRDGLRDIPGVRLAGPQAWELSSGITSIQFPGRSPQQILGLVSRLREERRICTKYRPEIGAVRVATAPFNTAEEVDWLLEALAQLVPEM